MATGQSITLNYQLATFSPNSDQMRKISLGDYFSLVVSAVACKLICWWICIFLRRGRAMLAFNKNTTTAPVALQLLSSTTGGGQVEQVLGTASGCNGNSAPVLTQTLSGPCYNLPCILGAGTYTLVFQFNANSDTTSGVTMTLFLFMNPIY